jgi:MerR family transcriptional regulator/heat shock protein HspR
MRRNIFSHKPDDDPELPTIGDYHETPHDDPTTGGSSPPSPETIKPGKRTSNLSQIGADRPIFTLSVAADLLGLHPRTLRIYEEKKLVVPARTEGNRRRYSQNDITRFHFIRRLTRGGVNLEGVRVILDMADELSTLGGSPEAVIERNLQALDEW